MTFQTANEASLAVRCTNDRTVFDSVLEVEEYEESSRLMSHNRPSSILVRNLVIDRNCTQQLAQLEELFKKYGTVTGEWILASFWFSNLRSDSGSLLFDSIVARSAQG